MQTSRNASKRQRLREGFTTGSAASAAAAAALEALLSGKAASIREIAAPDTGQFPCARLRIPLAESGISLEDGLAVGFASVVKDGGDDPDATSGMTITAHVADRPIASALPPLVLDERITLYAGPGIGEVTLPGLPVAVGEMAVNPAPRRQIAAALREVAAQFGHSGPIHCRITAPEGEKRAKHTLNPRLGIHGGISILGTGGTVKPFSAEAWQATISQGLDVAMALNCATVCLTTGRRSERALQAVFPELPPCAFIQAADHAGFAVKAAVEHGFSRIVWGCFPGKLLKLAQGLAWTHARSSSPDLDLLAALCRKAGFAEDAIAEALNLTTVNGALELLATTDAEAASLVIRLMAERAAAAIRTMIKDVDARPGIVVYAFRMEGSLVATAEG